MWFDSRPDDWNIHTSSKVASQDKARWANPAEMLTQLGLGLKTRQLSF